MTTWLLKFALIFKTIHYFFLQNLLVIWWKIIFSRSWRQNLEVRMNFDCTVEPFACGSMKSSNVQQMHEGNIMVEFSVNPFFHLYKECILIWPEKLKKKKLKVRNSFFKHICIQLKLSFKIANIQLFQFIPKYLTYFHVSQLFWSSF